MTAAMTPPAVARQILTLLVVCHLHNNGASGLRDFWIRVPEAVRSGTSVCLSCVYDLEQVALYSIKWYRGDEEFYRYVPKENPPAKHFIVDGIDVDMSKSNEHEVTLRNVQRALTGVYKCEVSADAPLFHTIIMSAHMTVAEVPDANPSVSADRLEATIGETVHLTCKSPPSSPPANVTWFINGEPVLQQSKALRTSSVAERGMASDLQMTRAKLQVLVNKSVVSGDRNNAMHVRCVAAMFDLYKRSASLTVRVLPDPLAPAPIMGPTVPLALSDIVTANDGINPFKTNKALRFVFIIINLIMIGFFAR